MVFYIYLYSLISLQSSRQNQLLISPPTKRRQLWLALTQTSTGIRALHSLQLQRPLSADTDTQDTQIHAAIRRTLDQAQTGKGGTTHSDRDRAMPQGKRDRTTEQERESERGKDFSRQSASLAIADVEVYLAALVDSGRLLATFWRRQQPQQQRCKWGSRVVAN